MTEIVCPIDIRIYEGNAPIISPSLPQKMRPTIPDIISTRNTLAAKSSEKDASVSSGIKCTMGTDMQIQQKITAQEIQVITSFSLSGKSLNSSLIAPRALSRHGDSLIRREKGAIIKRYIKDKYIYASCQP